MKYDLECLYNIFYEYWRKYTKLSKTVLNYYTTNTFSK